ncbi:protein YLS9-like [Pyrus ussuriensis x Pyrus communis]|uniref:Protein YLS9-like n=1 Tax=Pyrus ussuriensis x Pyrus communis TaxID=2448454 RepID=A0A5N5HYX4_9ROSA|nr:protein YLS9-like [Pyrus ussuriensis x Pyrus communis]
MAAVWFSTIFPHPKSKFLKPNKQNPFALALAVAVSSFTFSFCRRKGIYVLLKALCPSFPERKMGGLRRCMMPSPCALPPVRRKPTILCRIIMVTVAIFTIMSIIFFISWLSLLPQLPKFRVESATISPLGVDYQFVREGGRKGAKRRASDFDGLVDRSRLS